MKVNRSNDPTNIKIAQLLTAHLQNGGLKRYLYVPFSILPLLQVDRLKFQIRQFANLQNVYCHVVEFSQGNFVMLAWSCQEVKQHILYGVDLCRVLAGCYEKTRSEGFGFAEFAIRLLQSSHACVVAAEAAVLRKLRNSCKLNFLFILVSFDCPF